VEDCGGRQLEIEEVEELIKNRVVGRCRDSQQAGPAVRRSHQADAGTQAGVYFGQDQTNPDGTAVEVDFSARNRWANARSAGTACSRTR